MFDELRGSYHPPTLSLYGKSIERGNRPRRYLSLRVPLNRRNAII